MINFRGTYKYILFFGIALLTTTFAAAQTSWQPKPSQELKEAAREQVEIWEEELSLTAKQMSLMERKFIEFAMKKDKVLQSKMREEAKAERLVELQESENRDMRDILTKPQFDRYLVLQKQKIRQQGAEN